MSTTRRRLIDGARQLPTAHISIRVPWHDGGWKGTVCSRPRENTSCLVLRGIADKRAERGADAHEEGCKGQRFDSLTDGQRPPCDAERATFMAPFGYTRTTSHPYSESSPETHGDFLPTAFQHRPFSAACIPFRWMLKGEIADGEGTKGLASRYHLGYQPDREPELKFQDNWVQERSNQLVMLDTFFSSVQPRSPCASSTRSALRCPMTRAA